MAAAVPDLSQSTTTLLPSSLASSISHLPPSPSTLSSFPSPAPSTIIHPQQQPSPPTSLLSNPTASQLQLQPQPGDGRTLDNTGYCLLSLDGGGVRGLSTLYILGSIMKKLNFEREKRGLRPRKPCEIFDLIGGTSTGGLIAIMLGHLEMSVEECIAAYTKLMKHVFEKRKNRTFVSKLGRVKARFSSDALKEAISVVLKERGRSVNDKFEDGSTPRCKVFVCTKFQKTNTITRLRNYRVGVGSDNQPTILEAALATSAAPTYFSEASIEDSKFVDGAIGANNPAEQVEQEASDLWCYDTGQIQPLVKCFISIGTGHPGIRSVSEKGFKNFLETLQKEATETEDTNQRFMGRWRDHEAKGRCFRFNVEHGLESVRLAEFEEQVLIRDATASYLEKRETMGRVSKCVENLRMKEYEPTEDFVRRLRDEIQANDNPPPYHSLIRATPAEIAELIDLGNRHLKTPSDRITRTHLLTARSHFARALSALQSSPTTTPKQTARLYQKLMETSLLLSMKSSDAAERKTCADKALEHGQTALDNVLTTGDAAMVAQAEFLLACARVWKVYASARANGIDPRTHPARRGVEMMVEERLEDLRRFPRLDVEVYEAQAAKYLGYLSKPRRLEWE